MLALAVPQARAGLASAAGSFQKRVIDPLHAEEYLRWGMRYAEAGQLDQAAHNLARAAQLTPEDQRLKSWLRRVEQARERARADQP